MKNVWGFLATALVLGLTSCSTRVFENVDQELSEAPFHGITAGYFDPLNLRTEGEFYQDVFGRSGFSAPSRSSAGGGDFSANVSVGGGF